MRTKFSALALLLVLGIAAPIFATEVLTLQAYLGQVGQRNSGVLGLGKSMTASAIKAEKEASLTAPIFFANGQYFDEKKITNSAFFMGQKTIFSTASTGLSATSDFGLSGKLYYQLNYYNFPEGSTLLPQTQYLESAPALELNYSLFRNGGGREVRYTQDVIRTGHRKQALKDEFSIRQAVAMAEVTYWQLALGNEEVRSRVDALERARKMHDWARRQSSLQLIDKADLIAAEANVQLRQLELAQAEERQIIAARNFNVLRGVDSQTVEESVQTPEQLNLDQFPNFDAYVERESVGSAKENSRLTALNASLSSERLKPSFDVYTRLILNQRGTRLSTVLNNTLSTDYPTYVVGFNYAVSLDNDMLTKMAEANKLEADSAQLSFEQQKVDELRDWVNLKQRYDALKQQLTMAIQLEQIQKSKWQHEVARHKLGRSTTFQIITYEQDYANAEYSRIQMQIEICRLIAQLRTYAPMKGTL